MAAIEERYAQALADLVAKGDAPAGQLRADLAVLAALAANPGLRAVFASPAVGWDKKRALLEALAARAGVSRLARNLLLVAAQRGRFARLPGIEAAFEQLLLDREGVVLAEVSSARELEAAERAGLEAELGRRLGRKLRTRYLTDPELVGGFVARVGDQVFDGSLRGRLERLRRQLVTA